MNQENDTQTEHKDISVEHPWDATGEQVCGELRVEPEQGLTASEVRRRVKQWGPNQLKAHKAKSVWAILYDQLKSLIIVLLAAATLISFLTGDHIEGWAILVVIVINTAIGFFTEMRAVRSMEALYKLGTVTTRVKREGQIREIDAKELVPGDIVVLEGGDVLTADMRILEASKLQADESTLTGESMPISKQIKPVDADTVLAERSNMLYKGTAVTRGSGLAVVTATGMHTELGNISSLVEEAEQERTPLEERLDTLGNRLIIVTVGISVIITIVGIISGKELYLMIETGIALAVATIPEGLPIVATIALARGLKTMADRNALITRLSSVETLGATEVIFTDKTGTLTENRMTVTQYVFPENQVVRLPQDQSNKQTNALLQTAIQIGILCNNGSWDEKEGKGTGDPLEVALLAAARNEEMSVKEIKRDHPELREEAFDSDIKMMATWNEFGDDIRVSVKGAPGAVLDAASKIYKNGAVSALTEQDRRAMLEKNEELASQGYRLLALAYKEVSDTKQDPYHDLVLVGLVVLEDPPRSDVKGALKECRSAGIRVVMVTGDQEATARSIGNAVGLIDEIDAEVIHGQSLESSQALDRIEDVNIYARISPKQKLDLIEQFQKAGHTVAMTGDGVNDAPALKKADIGIAMGQRGTQVAKEAADMILTDDAFATIVKAIEQGRVIFDNIRSFIYYLMSCNLSEVLVIGIAFLANTPLPILPLQILFLNLVTDVFPALALGLSRGDEHIMKKSPRDPEEAILDGKHWLGIAGYGVVISLSVFGILVWSHYELGLPQKTAVTLSFLTLALAQLWHVFNMRPDDSKWWRNPVVENRWVWGALVLCMGMILTAVYVPVFANALSVVPPTLQQWGYVFGFSLIPLVIGQLRKSFR
ncbi:MAG: cation-translocating P-type ATPase [Bacteroidota bacterium]